MRDISLHLLDIIQNSVTANANHMTVEIETNKKEDKIIITVSDNGKGIDKDFLPKVTDPFATTRTTRKVGLGIPLLKASAEMAGGYLEIHSEKGKGTVIKAIFTISHIDRIPMGDIAETVVSVMIAYPDLGVRLVLKNEIDCFTFSTEEITRQLGEVPITNYEVLTWIKDFIKEGLNNMFGGVLNEINS